MESNKKVKLNDNAKRQPSSRNWITTVNNPEPDAQHAFDIARSDPRVSFACGQEEQGEQGTRHLQMFTNWKASIRFETIRKVWPTGHHEICNNPGASLLYCQKADTRLNGPWRFGVDPVSRQPNKPQREKTTVQQLLSYTEEDLQGLSAQAYISAKKAISLVPGLEYVPTDVRGIWIYGVPKSGKSRYVYEKYPGAYRKPQSKWFDGYQRESTIVLDDLDKMGGQMLGHYLKIWADRYPCRGEVKGASVQLRHDAFIVTSNYSIKELWPEDELLQAAIRRRFKVIKFVLPGNGYQPDRPSVSGDIEITYEGQLALDNTTSIILGGTDGQSDILPIPQGLVDGLVRGPTGPGDESEYQPSEPDYGQPCPWDELIADPSPEFDTQ